MAKTLKQIRESIKDPEKKLQLNPKNTTSVKNQSNIKSIPNNFNDRLKA